MWSIIGTAVQGRGHESKGIPVQDKISHQKGEVNVIALADGAGSAKLSHFGAETTVETVCNLLKERFDDIYQVENAAEAQKLIMEEILSKLIELAEQMQEPVSAFASTLLAVAVKDDRVLILHLGDGEIGAIKNGKMIHISSADNGEYANATYFTTSAKAASHLKLYKSSQSQQFSSFFLMSDGSAFSLYSKRSKHFSAVIEQLAKKSQIHKEEILNDLLQDSFENLVKQKTNDDCSFIMMTKVENKLSYSSLNEYDKYLLLRSLDSKKHCSVRKWDKIANILCTPSNLSQIAKSVYVKKRYVRSNLRALQSLGFVEYKNDKFQLAEGSIPSK